MFSFSNLNKTVVLSRPFIDRIINHYKGGVIHLKGKILKQTINNVGYYIVVLSKNGIIKTHSVHKFVAMAFLNHNPCGYKLIINHNS